MYRIVKKSAVTVLTLIALLGMSAGGAIAAGNQEPAGINLGGTSFFDGFGGTKEGWAYIGYYQAASYAHIEDNHGNDVPVFKNPRINDLLMLNQIVHTTSYTLFKNDGHIGFTALLPILIFNTHFDSNGLQLNNDGNGFGDLTAGVYVQMNPVIRNGRPVFSQRFELDVIAPLGKYDSRKDINPGSNFWSISPYWAATVLPTPKTEISWRLLYLYNFKNNDPAGVPSTVTDAKAGQAAWINFAASYAIKQNLNVGLNGYFFKQFTKDKFTYQDGSTTDGQLFGDSGKAEVFAIGPGMFWKINKGNTLAVNLYFQTMAHNRARGNVFNVQWTHPF